ncbi:MAG: AtpZ/AtpI family protein [Deltaproteobacteria bacterium]|nr:AtpZ/AtpI family protein [Deltaproteobacteria bacterium]
MPEEKSKADQKKKSAIGSIILLSAWGMAMVVSSFLFLYIGYLVDKILGTLPNFMLGSFFLAIGLCIWRLYKEAKQKGKYL